MCSGGGLGRRPCRPRLGARLGRAPSAGSSPPRRFRASRRSPSARSPCAVSAVRLNGYLEVRAWRGLWETTTAGSCSRRSPSSCPSSRSASTTTAAPSPGCGRPALRPRRSGAVSSALPAPSWRSWSRSRRHRGPRRRAAGTGRGRSRPARYATTTPVGDELELNLVVDPARPGQRDPPLPTNHTSGQPTDVDEGNRRGLASEPADRPPPLRPHIAPLRATTSSHGAQLALAGDWQLRVEARQGEFDAATQPLGTDPKAQRH